MMHNHLTHLAINVEKQGPVEINKESFPLRYGRYSEIRTPDHEFIFNLNGEIKFIRGLNTDWPSPAEQLKRTDGNDWVYYTVGDDSTDQGIISWLGEYYLPCLPYPSNPIWEVDYFTNPDIMNAFAAWPQLYANLYGAPKDHFHFKARNLISRILACDDSALHQRSQDLQEIIGERVSVLPPDTRHVDYEVIPLTIADGCLYHCKFCCVQSARRFHPRSAADIDEQMHRLKAFYGPNIVNYNGLFLGNHDALAAGGDLIVHTAAKAHQAFGFQERPIRPYLFLFGSVDALLKSDNRLLERLDQLPFHTCINIGLESVDPPTLEFIGKPLNETKVRQAFGRLLDINAAYEHVEITANFVIGKGLPAGHYPSLRELLRDIPGTSHRKGATYLSPIKDSPKKRELLPVIRDIKIHSKLPVFIYLIQRL